MSDVLFVFEIQWVRASSPLQEDEIQCAPPRIAVHKENVYIAVNLLGKKMKLFRSADFVWQKVTVPDCAISCHGLASDGESLFLLFLTGFSQKLFLGRYVDDSWIISKHSCPIVQHWPGMCVREGHVNLVGGFTGSCATPKCTSCNIESGRWSIAGAERSEVFPDLPHSQARIGPDLYCIANEWYIIGGSRVGFEHLATLKLTNVGGITSWEEGRIPAALQGAATAEHDGWLFAIGGAQAVDVLTSEGACLDSRNCELARLPSIPNSRFSAVLTVFRDKLVLFGGRPLGKKWHNDLLTLDLSKYDRYSERFVPRPG